MAGALIGHLKQQPEGLYHQQQLGGSIHSDGNVRPVLGDQGDCSFIHAVATLRATRHQCQGPGNRAAMGRYQFGLQEPRSARDATGSVHRRDHGAARDIHDRSELSKPRVLCAKALVRTNTASWTTSTRCSSTTRFQRLHTFDCGSHGVFMKSAIDQRLCLVTGSDGRRSRFHERELNGRFLSGADV